MYAHGGWTRTWLCAATAALGLAAGFGGGGGMRPGDARGDGSADSAGLDGSRQGDTPAPEDTTFDEPDAGEAGLRASVAGDAGSPEAAAGDGGCDLACGQPCTAGRCLLTLALAWVRPYAVAVDATSVYFTTNSPSPDGVVMKIPIGGGAATILASGLNYPHTIVVDATNLYWTNAAPIRRTRAL
jgi:hypothetical protein